MSISINRYFTSTQNQNYATGGARQRCAPASLLRRKRFAQAQSAATVSWFEASIDTETGKLVFSATDEAQAISRRKRPPIA
ncbi:hypothetical protein BB776_00960 [Planococcus salinarum]|uniref:Uncharacterized protein n=1 Tax=Planococcus salinarum TaxID=622695 RepID=A0ABX3CWA4_9BACL|nr:hypothetical protein BB776_00960 [Planococcus salinarum]